MQIKLIQNLRNYIDTFFVFVVMTVLASIALPFHFQLLHFVIVIRTDILKWAQMWNVFGTSHVRKAKVSFVEWKKFVPPIGQYHRCQAKRITNLALHSPLRTTEKLRKCQGTGALLLQALGPSSDEDEDLQENQPDMVEVVIHKSQSWESVKDYLRNVYNSYITQKVEQITWAQSEKWILALIQTW